MPDWNGLSLGLNLMGIAAGAADNILHIRIPFMSAGSKIWYMEYISKSLFTTGHKFTIKIEKSNQIKSFESPYFFTNFRPRLFLDLIFDYHLQLQ